MRVRIRVSLGGGDPAPQGMRDPAEPGQHALGQVSGMIADLAEVPGPGQRARDSDREDEGEQAPPSAALPGIGDLGEHLQQPRDVPACAFISAGHGGIAGMRDWHGGLSWRWDLDSTPVIKPDGRPLPRISARPSGQLAATHPAVKSGTHALVAPLGHVTPTRRSRGTQPGLQRSLSTYAILASGAVDCAT
jgi:hypothetical protein